MMLAQLVFLVLFQTILADPVPVRKPYYDVSDYGHVGRHFEKFIKDHNRQYDNEEKAIRFKNFIENLKEINKLNKKHPQTTFNIGKFADKSKEDMESFYGFNPMGVLDPNGDCEVKTVPQTKDAPAAWDWRDHDAVSPVKDQKMCGSCWAFSATAMVESRNWQIGVKANLSEQQMMDCDKSSHSCKGGLMSTGLTELIRQGGQEAEEDYPYEAHNGTCRFDAKKIASKVVSCRMYSISDEDKLKELLYKEGPLSIAVDATFWLNYGSGVFKDCSHRDLGHGVLLVGYGSEDGVDFWVIKNSWGEVFGDKGYIKIQRGVNCAGIADDRAFTKVSASIA